MTTSTQGDRAGLDDVDSVRSITTSKCSEFSLKIPEDKRKYWVTGIIWRSDILIVVDTGNHEFKIFDHHGKYLSSTRLKLRTLGITRVGEDRLATCGAGRNVDLWAVHGNSVVAEDKSFKLQYEAHGLGYSGEYYCVLHRDQHSIVILDSQGTQLRQFSVTKAFEKTFEIGWDIHMDKNNRIYIPCTASALGILCLSVEGEPVWMTSLPGQPIGITEVQGLICTVDHANRCLHFISKTGKYCCKAIEKDNFEGEPRSVCFNDQRQFYLSYYAWDKRNYVISKYDYSLEHNDLE